MQEQGYDAISDDLSKMLEDTEYEIAHNADKQLEIVNSMLDKVVGSYQSAYNKINSIISNTGWVGSADFNQNQSNLGTSAGAESQRDNASQAQASANKAPSSAASGTKTDPIKDNAEQNNSILNDVMQKENTEHRLVAELKLSKSSVTLEEGKSTTVTASIRPNDAANKTLNWGSSNLSIASASNGTITAKSPGSCQIVVSTTDGSGISQTIGVTVTKKPEPVKPSVGGNANGTGGDGIPRVGDVVTFKGRYYHDSWGMQPAGNLYSGVPNGVVIDSMSASEYGGTNNQTGGLKIHIKSRDGKYGDLGWVSLNQISGYAKGTTGVSKDQYAWTDENGEELIIRSDGAVLRRLNKGDGVIPNNPTERLMKLTKNVNSNGEITVNGIPIDKFMENNIPDLSNANLSGKLSSIAKSVVPNCAGDINITYDKLLNVEGNVDRDVLPDLNTILQKSYDYNVKKLSNDLKKAGFRKSR